MPVKRSLLAFTLLFLWYSSPGFPQTATLTSVNDALYSARERLADNYSLGALTAMTPEEAARELTEEEREVLGTAHVRFEVNVPVRVYVLHDKKFSDTGPFEPFWLQERGFEKTELEVRCDTDVFVAHARDFEAGPVGLGINSFTGNFLHYFVAVKPLEPGAALEVTNLMPESLSTVPLEVGAKPYPRPDWDPVTSVAPELKGATMVQVDIDWRRSTRLLDFFRETQYPATARADQVRLTWSDDPKTTQSIQWRTSVGTPMGAVAYMKKADYNNFNLNSPQIVDAESILLETQSVLNQKEIYLHAATLTGLEPGTSYVYAVGDGTETGWTELAEFATAPGGTEPFSFVYMGDVQAGMGRWRSLLIRAYRERPDAAFYLLAGDNVNRGNDRNEWDALFYHGRSVFDRRAVAPAIGNHEYHGGLPDLYRAMFTLGVNGPERTAPEHAYSFEYGNALFIVLDSNLHPEVYTEWLDKTLGGTKAVWKFVAMHHPLYSSGPGRDNPWLRDAFLPLFDKYHVDMVLQGHDHAYLRTYPMNGDKRVKTTAEGTVYVVSVSGTKWYELSEHSYTEVGFEKTSTYQVIDIQTEGDRLVYRSYDVDGNLKDELIIEKQGK